MASNAQKRAEKAKQAKLEEDPDYVAPVAETDTKKIVEDAIKSIKKSNGGNTFERLKDKSKSLRPVLPTGLFALDHHVLGSGGFPRGRIVELFGSPSSGKSSLATQLIANTQKTQPNLDIAYVDMESAFDHSYAATLGVDTDNLLISEPQYGEQALQQVLDIVETGGISLVIVDSVSNLVPKAELEGEIGDSHMGLLARLMGQSLRKLTGIVSRTNTCLVFINQTRSNMNTGFGAKTDTSGGKALKFYSSVRLSVDRLSAYKEKDTMIGSVTKIKAVKNKTARPFEEFDFNFLYETLGFSHVPGFDGPMSLVELAIQHGVWKQAGPTYTLVSTGEQVKGRVALRDALLSDNTTRLITEEAVLVAMGKQPDYIKRSLSSEGGS